MINVDTQAEPLIPTDRLVSQPVKPVLRQMGEWMGLTDEPVDKLVDLPPWTSEQADAFERAIADACEQVES